MLQRRLPTQYTAAAFIYISCWLGQLVAYVHRGCIYLYTPGRGCPYTATYITLYVLAS